MMRYWPLVGASILAAAAAFLVLYYPTVVLPDAFRWKLAGYISIVLWMLGALLGSRAMRKYGYLAIIIMFIWPALAILSYLIDVNRRSAWPEVSQVSIGVSTTMCWILAAIVGWLIARLLVKAGIAVDDSPKPPRRKT